MGVIPLDLCSVVSNINIETTFYLHSKGSNLADLGNFTSGFILYCNIPYKHGFVPMLCRIEFYFNEKKLKLTCCRCKWSVRLLWIPTMGCPMKYLANMQEYFGHNVGKTSRQIWLSLSKMAWNPQKYFFFVRAKVVNWTPCFLQRSASSFWPGSASCCGAAPWYLSTLAWPPPGTRPAHYRAITCSSYSGLEAILSTVQYWCTLYRYSTHLLVTWDVAI